MHHFKNKKKSYVTTKLMDMNTDSIKCFIHNNKIFLFLT